MAKKLKVTAITFIIIGVATLAAGAVLLALRLTRVPAKRDAEYLVEVGSWAEQGVDGVVWDFTEVGNGTLTTNNHINDYPFLWALNDDTLSIETEWLYTLNNDYTYVLDQSAGTLTLTAGEEVVVFTPVPQNNIPQE